MHNYIVNQHINFNCGFPLSTTDVVNAIHNTNDVLEKLPASLFRSIDYKTTSAMIGCILCENIAIATNGMAIVNPIEKGHPDIVPQQAIGCTEEQLRNYPIGLEVKCTIGGVPKGSNIGKAAPRIDNISNVTWQAHHQEVSELFGVTFDYIPTFSGYKPVITATFYCDHLGISDWGDISGTKGRNTKVCGMKASGRKKMGSGWFTILNDSPIYLQKYSQIFKFYTE